MKRVGHKMNWTEITKHLKKGGMLLYPTETLWGLGADPHHPSCSENLFDLKKRSPQNPMSLLVSGVAMAYDYADIDPYAFEFLNKVWPRPVTFVLPARDKALAKRLGSSEGLIGLRVSTHPWVGQFFENWTLGAIISTSANISAQSYCEQGLKAFKAAQNLMIVEDQTKGLSFPEENLLGTTVVKVSSGQVQLLRQGAYPFDEIYRG